MATETVTQLGEGVLNWPRGERTADRYGAVMLLEEIPAIDEGEYSASLEEWLAILQQPVADFADAPEDAFGRLVAKVIRTRPSYHVGDLFREIYPPADPADFPEVGSEHVLGEGTLFVVLEDGSEIPLVGVAPADGREADWLDPKVLYLLHNQTVELRFEAA